VARCFTDADVSGENNVGGLIGQNNATLSNCYATGAVTGDNYVGGLAGFNKEIISRCYSIGRVTGNDCLGGLVAADDTHATVASFWDVQTSGLTVSAGGTGLTTAEMMTTKTFLDAGWDLPGETANGTADIWRIDEGRDYPRLTDRP
jgi:hypothetical protein